MKLPNQFQIMLVKDKKPLMPWKELTEREQTQAEKNEVLSRGGPGTIGIVTGAVSRIFVLDIDGAEGEEAIKGKHIPRTWTVRTPHGRHYYFRWSDVLDGYVTTRAGVLDKVDVRGDGGYVVFYGWETAPTVAPLASPPQWLIDLLHKKESRQITTGPLATLGTIKEGNRNQSFTSLAGSLRARGYTVDVIFELLRPKAREVAFPESELMTICQSIGRYDAPKLEGQGESVEAFLADRQDVKWICEPFIAEQSIGFIAGLPESRKSWILIDLAVACASGSGSWLNRYPINLSQTSMKPSIAIGTTSSLVNPVLASSRGLDTPQSTIQTTGHRVLLIDQERSKSETQRRLQAVIAGKGLAVADIKNTLFVRSSTSTRLDNQASYESLRKELAELRPTLLLVDSFATSHQKNESNRMEIQQVIERIKEIRNDFKCAVIFIHHETKSSYAGHREGQPSSYLDMSGNVAIPAAAEFCMNVVKRDDDSSWCHHTKSTQGMKAPPFVVKVTGTDTIKVEAF